MRSLSESIPLFPTFNTAGTTYQWCAEPYWQTEEQLYFFQQSKNNSSSLLRPPRECVRKRQELQRIIRHRLLLKTMDERSNIVAWSIADCQSGRYQTGLVLLAGEALSPSLHRDASNHLISCCFFGLGLEQLKFVLLEPTSAENPELKEFPERQILHIEHPSGLASFSLPTLQSPLKAFDLDRTAWHKLYQSKEFINHYRYLEMRLERQKKRRQLEQAPRKRRRSFLARLLNPKIDDSFF